MANFMLTLGLTTAIMAGRLARNPLEGHLLADYPGWQEWLPLLGEQCSAFMGAVRQVIDHLVDPSGADAASDRAPCPYNTDSPPLLTRSRFTFYSSD
jgi:hypothetical protein